MKVLSSFHLLLCLFPISGTHAQEGGSPLSLNDLLRPDRLNLFLSSLFTFQK